MGGMYIYIYFCGCTWVDVCKYRHWGYNWDITTFTTGIFWRIANHMMQPVPFALKDEYQNLKPMVAQLSIMRICMILKYIIRCYLLGSLCEALKQLPSRWQDWEGGLGLMFVHIFSFLQQRDALCGFRNSELAASGCTSCNDTHHRGQGSSSWQAWDGSKYPGTYRF